MYNLSIFKGIDKKTVDSIIENCPEEVFTKGEMILAQGEQSNSKGYIIKSGEVQVTINGEKITELPAGNIVGEIALLNEEERTATVQALSETTMIVLTIDNLIEMINNGDNNINKQIMKRMEANIENELK